MSLNMFITPTKNKIILTIILFFLLNLFFFQVVYCGPDLSTESCKNETRVVTLFSQEYKNIGLERYYTDYSFEVYYFALSYLFSCLIFYFVDKKSDKG
ncbi:hypothetical protein HY450_00505 [Candidatus Pacearchaeota archaeon]|nr:hypothetical protein [Candidatus Pacearchaeota archaeon]